MPQQALICTECGLSQNVAYERAKRAITVATFLGLIFSSIAFVWPYAQTIYLNSFTRHDLDVVAMRTERDMLISNPGKIPVFASHVDISAPDFQRAAFIPIAAIVEPGQTIKIDTRGLYARRVETSDDLPAWVATITAPDILFDSLGRGDVTPVYFAKSDFEFEALNRTHAAQKQNADRLGGRLSPVNVKPANCLISYSSSAQGKTSDTFECVMAVATKGDMGEVIWDLSPAN
jgi:hypothetical protein